MSQEKNFSKKKGQGLNSGLEAQREARVHSRLLSGEFQLVFRMTNARATVCKGSLGFLANEMAGKISHRL
jgi:hypothetical protein